MAHWDVEMYSPILTENSEHFCGVFVLWLLGSRIAHLSLGSHTSGAARGWEKEEDTQQADWSAEVRDTEHGIGIDATLSSKLYFKGICTRVHKGSSARRSPFNCVLIVCSFSSCRAKIRFYPADNPWLCFFLTEVGLSSNLAFAFCFSSFGNICNE